MNKKAFTAVELIVSFVLATSIALILLQVVLALKTLYVTNGYKTQLLNKQGIIVNKINESFTEKEIISVVSCGLNCYEFTYTDSVKETLSVKDNIIQFGTYSTKLIDNSTIGNIKLNTIKAPTFNSASNNAILRIDIPVTSDDLEGDYGIHVIYQYNSSYNPLPEFKS